MLSSSLNRPLHPSPHPTCFSSSPYSILFNLPSPVPISFSHSFIHVIIPSLIPRFLLLNSPPSFLLNSPPSSLQGHSDIESQGANHEQFRVILDRPKMNIWAVMSDDRFYTVYVEDASGLFNNNNMAVHGLIGKWGEQ